MIVDLRILFALLGSTGSVIGRPAGRSCLGGLESLFKRRPRERRAPPGKEGLLINGKHLVQSSLAGGNHATLRIANWIIRQELEGRR